VGGPKSRPLVMVSVMAKSPDNKKAKSVTAFSLRDRVEILHFGPGKITALRGLLGPGGAQIYRVLYRRKPNAAYDALIISKSATKD